MFVYSISLLVSIPRLTYKTWNRAYVRPRHVAMVRRSAVYRACTGWAKKWHSFCIPHNFTKY